MSIYSIYNDLKYDMSIIEKDILKNIKEIIKEINPKNIHELFYIYCYLLMKGYFSKDKYYEYSDIDENLEIDEVTFNEFKIYSGKGVCRHNATQVNKILKTLEINSNFIGLNVQKINTNNLMNFTPNIGECLKISNSVIDKFNHASVYVETNVSDFILDPTNLCEIEIIKNKEIYCPTGEYVVNMNFLKKTLPNKEYKEKSTIKKEDLIEYYKVAKEKIINNKNIIEEFYKNNEEKYKEISKKLEYFKLSY